jgi:hypothetical protein
VGNIHILHQQKDWLDDQLVGLVDSIQWKLSLTLSILIANILGGSEKVQK